MQALRTLALELLDRYKANPATAELRDRLTKLGLEPAGGTAADLAARMAQDSARWAPIVKASGFRAD